MATIARSDHCSGVQSACQAEKWHKWHLCITAQAGET